MRRASGTSGILLLLSRQGDLRLLRDLLEGKGYRVFTELPAEGSAAEVDVVLFDVRGPKKLLEEVLLLKKRSPLFLPVIALVRSGVRVDGLYKLGFDDCIHYPVYQAELLKRLEFFLRFRQKLRELKEKEEDQRLKTLGFLALGIAHDFNNFLTPILGYVDLCLLEVQQGRVSERVVSYLQRIREIVNQSRSLVEQISLFCNPDQKPYKPVDVAQEVANIEPLLRAAVPLHIDFQLEIKGDHLWVRLHPGKIHRLLFNLLTNAIEALGEQRGHIKVEVFRRASEEGEWVFLVVEDDGPGLEEGERERIFDLFYSSTEGVGIGLNIVKSIVEEAGGEIEVESAPGKGARFEVRLPLADAVPEESPFVPGVAEASARRSGPGRVLLVDDEFTILELLKQFFEAQGFEVLTASSAREALELFRKHEDIVLVISDFYLPNITGDALLREIRRENPEVPVILCSGEEKPDVADLPRLKFIRKPFSLKDLHELVTELLGAEEPLVEGGRAS
ncbi:MAG: response regulator [Thermodesulfobacteria bacterium]|nr:response regulator [Thermodesulfobacteriota bacterium]